MRLRNALKVLFLVFAVAARVTAQSGETTAETVARLRLQLIDIQTKDEQLRARLQQLEEELRPENIERAFAGIGFTKPEEVRENRRRQLTIEKNSAAALLKVLETNRTGLEAAIMAAESQVYQQSAYPEPPANHLALLQDFGVVPWSVLVSCAVVMAMAMLATTGFAVIRKRV